MSKLKKKKFTFSKDSSRFLKKSSQDFLSSSESKGLAFPDPLSYYLFEVRKYPVLSREEEMKIAEEYRKSGDVKLAEILVTSNLRFVVKIAMEYSKFGAHIIDLIQEGNMGLMRAVKEYNPYKNVRLITYAVWWIKGYIQEYLMKQHSLVKIGTTKNQRKLFYQLQKQKQALERDQSAEEKALLISRKLNVPKKDVQSMRERLFKRDISLNFNPEGGLEENISAFKEGFLNQIGVEEELEKLETLEELKKHISHLRSHINVKETFILENRILSDQPLTLQEIGKKFGTTREAVRQMEGRLIKKIKDQMLKGKSLSSHD